jgi:hypothetical protein
MTLDATDLLPSSSLALLQATLDYNTKLVELALINICSAFEYARKLSRVESSSEFVEVVSNHTRDQFEALSEQVEELSALMQKASLETVENTEVSFGD